MHIYSHSRLETFENCALKYRFQYIDRIKKPGFESVEAFLGKRVHEALKKLYDDLAFNRKNSAEELLAYYRTQWDKEWGPGVAIVEAGRTQRDYFEYGAAGIQNYYREHAPFQDSHTLATEERIQFPLDEVGHYQIQGYVDRIDRLADGSYEIHDYKTSRSVPPQQEADTNRQLGLYEIGLRQRWTDVQRVELILHYVRHGVSLRSKRSDQQLTQLRQTAVQLIERIESEKEFEPRKSALCDWCEFKPDCPIWKHVVSVEALPREEFKEDQGVKLVDEYERLKSTIQKLEQDLMNLRDKILAFSKEQSISAIQGTRANLSIHIAKRLDFPKQGDRGRQDLESIIHRAGKWAEVSILSLPRLAKVISEKNWPAEVLKKVAQFALRREVPTIRLHRADGSVEDEE